MVQSSQSSHVDLGNRAVLVNLIVSRWRAVGADKTVDAEVTRRYNAARKAGKFKKDLLDPKQIKKTQRMAYEVRKWHLTMTLPWDEKSRILPASLHERYKEGLSERTRKFNSAADEFMVAYPSLLRDAETELGPELFNRDDYPPITTIRNKFDVSLSYSPVPSAGDFRVNLASDELEKIKAELNERNKAMLERSMHEAWRRLHEVVVDMTERISKPNFRNTIIENIKNLADILPELNLAGDENLDGMRKDILDQLCRYTPEQLRNDEGKRSEVTRAAQNIIGTMRRLRVDLNEDTQPAEGLPN